MKGFQVGAGLCVLALMGLLNGCGSSAKFTIKGSGSATARVAARATTPSAHKVKVYQVWLSTSEYCTNPIKIIDNGADPTPVDIMQNQVLGEADLPAAGVYKCFIVVASDKMLITPTANDGTGCVAGTEFTTDTCKAGPGSQGAYPLPDGTTTTCDATENKTAAYFSTVSTNPNGDMDKGFYPPTAGDATLGMTLTGGAITVADAAITKTMFVDCTNKIQDNGGTCEMNACTVGFR